MTMTGTNVHYDAALDPALDGAFDELCHRYPLRVHYEDTDAGGIVYHAQYLAFAERARSAWLRCLGIDQPAMLVAENVGFVVRRIEIDFLMPSGLGTVLEVESSLLRFGGASLTLQQNVMNREIGHILARLVVDIGLVEFRNGNPPKICRLPAAIKAKFSGLVTSTS
ncbi:YbgC/FadM family acyl-CoA thioesterase [Candidatus Puniceispirillum sp.]|nr:YbgC/FadM family acyl-CoA thioesterase [Candidatus Puniceispirillum sp.]